LVPILVRYVKYKKRYVELFRKCNIGKNGASISLGTLKWGKEVTPKHKTTHYKLESNFFQLV